MLRQRLLCAALLVMTSGIASAQAAFTTGYLDVYAGPASGYPLVARLGPGTPLRVMGCLSDWSWCDVVFNGNRGWAYSPDMSYTYQGSRVPLYSYLPSLGIPIVTFAIGSYWDRYYRGRPWYSQRDTWMRRPPPRHVHPQRPPPMHHGPARPNIRPGARGRTEMNRPGPGARPGQAPGNRSRSGARPGDRGGGPHREQHGPPGQPGQPPPR